MGLAKTYCKEIANELDKIAIFLPGDPVKVGDIITFGSGLFNPGTKGSFDHVSSLDKLGVTVEITTGDSKHTYLYASKGSVGVSFTANGAAGNVGQGKLDISFTKEGSTYFAAVDCSLESIDDTSELVEKLKPHKDKIDWGNCFIVTSVTTAEKALIMQSNTKTANLTIEGNVKGLEPGVGTAIDAAAGVKINSYKDSSFIKPWSDNVNVFFSLSRFEKKFLGDWGLKTRSLSLDGGNLPKLEELNAKNWISDIEK